MSETGEVAGAEHRYTAALAERIEAHWQDFWESDGTFRAPNPAGPLADPERVADRPKKFVMDMFPYPSGTGLHVGHPLGYIATDVYCRFQRMTGHNVLHALGFDAFGLPAEQYAVQTGTHPRVTTEANIASIRAQLRRLGLGHDDRRSVETTDPDFYRWTQWIFLQIFNSYYDADADAARPVSELVSQFERGERATPDGRAWARLDAAERAEVLSEYRLAYADDAPVNWCPGLGTVLSNEEVTSDGRSERGNFPVFRANLRQWKMRITAYAQRLLDDLDRLEWPDAIKLQQRNWIGRSEGARLRFSLEGDGDRQITVFTTRQDTLFGATYMVLAPEHDLVDAILPQAWPEGVPEAWTGGAATPADAVAEYRRVTQLKSDMERQGDARKKTGVFTGGYALNPATGERMPVFVADYVLTGYGTGAVMAVPAHDARDFAFARAYELPMRCVVEPPEESGLGADPAMWDEAFVSQTARLCNSSGAELSLDGMPVEEAKEAVNAWLARSELGEGTVNYRLRDWLFSRQRYWGEPFPIVYDDNDVAIALPDHLLPVELPEIDDYSPRTFDAQDRDSQPETPLSRNDAWVYVTLDLGDGPKRYRRETNTMPNWAGSCWYELRYLDPTNGQAMVDPANEAYWMGPRDGTDAASGDPGGVDLYVGGAEHAVLHLLYARFWHKVLFDLGHVSSAEPFRALYNQGMIQGWVFRDSRGFPVPAAEVEEHGDEYWYGGVRVTRELGKIGKSLKNVISPEAVYEEYGADTLRLYEMSMGPLDVSRPWETRAVVGSFRFLQRLWRNIIDESTGDLRVSEEPADEETLRALHRTIDGMRRDFDGLKFNTAAAKATELNNHLVKRQATPREVAEQLVLLVAPLAPHIAEELWHRLGHAESLAYQPYPQADPELVAEQSVTCAVQVKGKLRDRLTVSPSIGEDELRQLALASEGVRRALGDAEVRKVIVKPPKLVNIVPG